MIESKEQASEIKEKMALGYIKLLENQEQELINQVNNINNVLSTIRNEIAVCKEAITFNADKVITDAINVSTTR